MLLKMQRAVKERVVGGPSFISLLFSELLLKQPHPWVSFFFSSSFYPPSSETQGEGQAQTQTQEDLHGHVPLPCPS